MCVVCLKWKPRAPQSPSPDRKDAAATAANLTFVLSLLALSLTYSLTLSTALHCQSIIQCIRLNLNLFFPALSPPFSFFLFSLTLFILSLSHPINRKLSALMNSSASVLPPGYTL